MADKTYIDPAIGAGCRTGGGAAIEPGPGVEATDRVIARLAERQHGTVARRQLLEMGIGSRAIGNRLERGSLHSLHLGVYAVGHPRPGIKGRWMAAVLACGPGALLSHRSAAACWGLLSASGAPEVTRPGKFRPRPRIVARFASVPADERALVDGIPVTSVARTIFDLAAVASRRRVERAMHEAEVRQLSDRLSVPDLMRRYPRRQGCRLLREAIGADGRGFVENDFEELFAKLLERYDLPRARFNADLAIEGRFVKPDCLWPEHRLLVELDGRAVHGTKRAFESDRERDRLLTAAGWRVVRVTWRQLHDEPKAIVEDLKRTLRASRPASDPK